MMPDERVVILCCGDLHLGRHPSRAPAGRTDFSVAAVWQRTVDLAIHQQVDLLVLTGDVIDRNNRFYEAIGPLEAGIRRLAEHNIQTLAVAGNHDFDVLPRVVDALGTEHFKLLGRDGVWETYTFVREGRPVLHLVGWSFPHQHFAESPLAALAALDDTTHPGASPTIPTLGVLHADLDQPTSPYAPVTSAELAARPMAGWLLGHIHKPTLTHSASGAPILYPGSLQPLDPGEPGAHGPWLIEVTGAGHVLARQVPLASLHYQALTLSLNGIADSDALEHTLHDQVRRNLTQLVEDTRAADPGALTPHAVVYRLTFGGRTRLHRQLENLSETIIRDFSPGVADCTAHIDKIQLDTRPDLDLAQVARASDPPGVLARLLLAIEDETAEISPEYRPLFDHLLQKLGEVRRARAFGPLLSENLIPADADLETARRWVQVEGMRFLDELLAQRAAPTSQTHA